MRIGLALAHYGQFADGTSVIRSAQQAEQAGFDSIWASDRLLVPLRPRDHYPGGATPVEFRSHLDPLTALSAAAAVTSTVRLGTSTLNGLWHPAPLLARTLGSLDQVCDGRLDVGLGLGWSRDEYQAVGVPWAGRGKRMEELLDVLAEWWTGDPVSHEGAHWSVPESHVRAKPAQRPHPPVYLGGASEASLERVGRRADGWLPAGLPVDEISRRWEWARRSADNAGRDPDSLRMVLRRNMGPDESPADVARHLDGLRQAGVHEAFLDLQKYARDVSEMVQVASAIRGMVHDR